MKLGRFGEIKRTSHRSNGQNSVTRWWVKEGIPYQGAIAAQEDHQFHENWKWGWWPFFIGMLLFSLSVASHGWLAMTVGEPIAWLIMVATFLLIFWGLGNVTFLKRHGRTEMTGQVVETMIVLAEYDGDGDYYRQRQADQMEYYRDKKGKGFFSGWSDEKIAAEMIKREDEALRWIEKHPKAIDRYLETDPSYDPN